jgi:uncharacterized Rmd1/YagE family protein
MTDVESPPAPVAESPPAPIARRLRVRAVLTGDRLNPTGIESREMVSTAPAAFRIHEGLAVLFRYGVVVLIGLDHDEEAAFLTALKPRISGEFSRYEEEDAEVELYEKEEGIQPGGPIRVTAFSDDHLLVIADVLAKSAVLAHDERRVAAVFEVIEPFARRLAEHGRTPRIRKPILKVIGNALLVQQRVSGRVAVVEKPDALWERHDLERLYARLEDEYELKERVEGLDRKLKVISETATALTDIIDTRRSLRLEWAIVLLIVFEIVLTLYQYFTK